MRKLMLISVFTMLGCTTSTKKISFNPTNSMCLDSTVANMQAAGCNAVAVEKTLYGITRLYCHEKSNSAKDSAWLTNEFYAIAFGTSIPEDTKPICTDPFLVMTSAERD
jgi:hypothetical protein|tara:strand:- start:6008 stop:6334 length:327 start_codon:yes stop_codon:yes gene_type:complete